MNPLLKNINSQTDYYAPRVPTPQQNPMMELISVLQNGANPQALAQSMLQNNPQAQPFLANLQNSGRNPKELALSMCRARGIPENEVMSIAQMVGAR